MTTSIEKPTFSYRKSLLWFIVFLVIIQSATIYFLDISRPPWGDENHYIYTVLDFGREISLDTLKNFNREVSPPLGFIFYALWGRVFGFQVPVLRILSVIIAFITFLLMHRLAHITLENGLTALLSTAFIVLNPYMLGLTVFIYNDMVTIMFLVICCIAIIRKRPLVFLVSSACALVCRQYFVFLPAAAGLYFLIIYFREKDRHALKMAVMSALSGIPLGLLMVLWGGLGPSHRIRNEILGTDVRLYFHLSYLTLYICLMFIYLLPIVLLKWKVFYMNLKVLSVCFFLSWTYWLFPVAAAQSSLKYEITTVGYFHRFLAAVLKKQFLIDTVFFICFFMGLAMAAHIVMDLFRRYKSRKTDYIMFLDMAILAFLAIMPLSFMVWEKYFLLVLPLLCARVLLPINTQTREPEEI
jgi:hypothetical protein